ncbi:hypothetical protein Ancab_034274 [Ancistrocladus abbreviatus]
MVHIPFIFTVHMKVLIGVEKALSDVFSYTMPSKNFFAPEATSGFVQPFPSGALDGLNACIKGANLDIFHVSLSSAVRSSSQGSGHDEGDALGDVYLWGQGTGDAILGGGGTHKVGGPGAKSDSFVPKVLESAVVLDVQNIACGRSHAALVTKHGEIFTWGEESRGKLGHGVDFDVSHPKLVDVVKNINFELVACGENHSCALSLSGDLYMWGGRKYGIGLPGQLDDVSHWVPKRCIGPLEGIHVSSVSCGPWHTAIVTSAGQLFTFGVLMETEEVFQNQGSLTRLRGRLGHGDKEARLVPTCVAALTELNFCQVACGHSLTVALTTTGQFYTMGGAVYGQLGSPHAEGMLPTCVEGKLLRSFVEEISCGAYHVAALTSRSEVYTWGKGANGRLGHGDTDDRSLPTLVEAHKDKQVKSVACGVNFTAVICLHKWVSGVDQSMCSGCAFLSISKENVITVITVDFCFVIPAAVASLLRLPWPLIRINLFVFAIIASAN